MMKPRSATTNKKKQSWRTKALNKLRDAIPKLTKLKKGPRQGMLTWFEGQRKDVLRGLDASATSTTDSNKVTNLKQLLSLPLEISDLEHCLEMGAAGALKEHCTRGVSSSASLDLNDLDDNAEFLTKLLVGEEAHQTSFPSSLEAQELLESTLQAPTAGSSTTSSYKPFQLGRTAQLTAVVLMIAQILIGAQLLRKYRKRKTQQGRGTQASTFIHTSTDATTGAPKAAPPAQEEPDHRRGDPSDRTILAGTNTRERRRSRNRSFSGIEQKDLPSLAPVPSTSPPAASLPAASSAKPEPPSLKKHLVVKSKANHHDDDRTAETDSLSVSEGVPQKLEQQGSPNTNTSSGDDNDGSPPQKGNGKKKEAQNILALLSFEGGTRDELDAGSNRTLPSDNKALPIPTLPCLLQDKFAQRMNKLKEQLSQVQQEQKTKLADSTQHVQLQYQETNVQYSDLTKRLESLTRSIQTKNAPKDITATQLAPLSSSFVSPAAPAPTMVQHQSTTVASPTTPAPAAAVTAKRCPSPEQVQAQAQVAANNEEQAKLLKQVTALQQDLKTQQDQYMRELHQKEGKLAELATRIQFLSHELERRVLHAKKLEAELEQTKKVEQKVSTGSEELDALKQQLADMSQQLQDTKSKFTQKETECQELLRRLRSVPPPSANNTPAQNDASAQEHQALMKELEAQLEQQDTMNQRSFEMTQMLEAKRADVIRRTKHLEEMSKEVEARRVKVEQMEAAVAATAAGHPSQQQQQGDTTISNPMEDSCVGLSTEELEGQLHALQEKYELQALECQKLNELLTNKAKLLKEKETECLELTSRLEKMTAQLQEKESKITQLEQDVQDKQDLAAQNEAITTELQVQQGLQEKMNQTTLQMIKLLEEKEASNADLTNKLEALTTELNLTKNKEQQESVEEAPTMEKEQEEDEEEEEEDEEEESSSEEESDSSSSYE